MIPELTEENTVVSHCDTLENNVLLLWENLKEVKLIDFEYTAFGPEEFDLANIFNEMIIDNNHQNYPFIKAYFDNFLSIEEVKSMIKQFLTLKHSNDLSKVDQNLDTHLWNFFKCALLNNLHWGIWAVLMIKEKDINNEVFNFGYVNIWMDIFEFTLEKFGEYLS